MTSAARAYDIFNAGTFSHVTLRLVHLPKFKFKFKFKSWIPA